MEKVFLILWSSFLWNRIVFLGKEVVINRRFLLRKIDGFIGNELFL